MSAPKTLVLVLSILPFLIGQRFKKLIFLTNQMCNSTGHLNTICQPSVITDSYTPFDWNPFWNQLKNEQLENDNYDCRSNISFFAVSIFNSL